MQQRTMPRILAVPMPLREVYIQSSIHRLLTKFSNHLRIGRGGLQRHRIYSELFSTDLETDFADWYFAIDTTNEAILESPIDERSAKPKLPLGYIPSDDAVALIEVPELLHQTISLTIARLCTS